MESQLDALIGETHAINEIPHDRQICGPVNGEEVIMHQHGTLGDGTQLCG